MFTRKTDQQLIESAMQGSERAWLNLVKRYEKRVYNYALRMSGNSDDALDIMQDVLVSVYRNLKNYRGEGEFPAWLFRIASFRCIDYFRRRQFHTPADEQELFDESHAHQPEMNLAAVQSNRDMTELMALLPLEQRQVIELKFFQNFTFDEISGQLGISSNTAKTRLYAALGKMKKQASHAPQLGAS
ncbi:MAG: RNA polymerase sigma factor [Pseudomonadales bacterium]